MDEAEIRRATLVIFIVSVVLAMAFSMLAMMSDWKSMSYYAGQQDIMDDGVFEVFDHFQNQGGGVVEALYLKISRVNCSFTGQLNYSIVNIENNETTNHVMAGNASIVRLNSTYSIVYFEYNRTSHCTLSFTMIYRVRHYRYSLLAIPAFICFAVSVGAMYKYLTSYSIEKYYEKK